MTTYKELVEMAPADMGLGQILALQCEFIEMLEKNTALRQQLEEIKKKLIHERIDAIASLSRAGERYEAIKLHLEDVRKERDDARRSTENEQEAFEKVR